MADFCWSLIGSSPCTAGARPAGLDRFHTPLLQSFPPNLTPHADSGVSWHTCIPVFQQSLRHHADPDIAQADDLAGADFAGFAQLLLAVDLDVAARDDHLAGAAAVADAGDFQQLIEFDVFALQAERDFLHDVPG